VNAYLLGGMVSSIAALQARNQTFYNAMDNLNRFLKEKRLHAKNPRLCERLRSYYIFRHRENDGDGWKDIVNRTSREMQGEVVQELHNDWLSNVDYFHGVDVDGVPWAVDEDFKLNLSLTMSVDIVAPLEAVFKEDSPIDKLYVIQQGLVGVHNRVMHRGQPFGEDVLVYYKETVDDLDEMFEATGRRFASRPNSRGYRATALTNLICMAFPGEAIHSLLAKPKYEYVRDQVRRKMFRWQVKHIWLNMMRTMHKAVAAETYADGVQILLEEFGEETLDRLPIITFHYMRLRELEGDDVVKVVRLFRKMSNRKSFVEAVKGLVERRRRINSLVAVRKELRDFLEPLEAMQHANDLIAQGVTIRTVKSFDTMELVASGIPVLLAKRIYNKARTLPEVGDALEELDGVILDRRFVTDEKVKLELAEMEEQENFERDRKRVMSF
jgi:CRP-like cAMP-binding protein